GGRAPPPAPLPPQRTHDACLVANTSWPGGGRDVQHPRPGAVSDRHADTDPGHARRSRRANAVLYLPIQAWTALSGDAAREGVQVTPRKSASYPHTSPNGWDISPGLGRYP